MSLSVVVTNAATDLGRGVCTGLERAGARVTSQLDAHDMSGAQLIQQAVQAFGCLDALVSCSQMLAQVCPHGTPSNRGTTARLSGSELCHWPGLVCGWRVDRPRDDLGSGSA